MPPGPRMFRSEPVAALPWRSGEDRRHQYAMELCLEARGESLVKTGKRVNLAPALADPLLLATWCAHSGVETTANQIPPDQCQRTEEIRFRRQGLRPWHRREEHWQAPKNCSPEAQSLRCPVVKIRGACTGNQGSWRLLPGLLTSQPLELRKSRPLPSSALRLHSRRRKGQRTSGGARSTTSFTPASVAFNPARKGELFRGRQRSARCFGPFPKGTVFLRCLGGQAGCDSRRSCCVVQPMAAPPVEAS